MRRQIPALVLTGSLFAGAAIAATAYPLAVSVDGRHILDNNGSILFFHGESPWHLFARLTREETTLYLDDRKARGFDALLVALFVSDGYNGSTRNAYGEEPFQSPGDFSAPNEAYFAHIDWVMQEAQARNFTLFIVPAYMGYNCGSQGWCAEMLQAGATTLRSFGGWIGTRYRDRPNIVWVHGGDTDARDYGAMDELQAVVDGILAADNAHLSTAHCNRNESAADCYALPWLQVNTTYSDCMQTPQRLLSDYNRSPRRPFVFIEGIYEGEFNFTQRCLRSQAYWSLLGGAVGQFYGSGQIWDFPANWESGLQSPGIDSMLRFRKLQLSRPWPLLEPDYGHTTLTAGVGLIGSNDYAPAARASDGSTAIAYLPSARTVTMAMGRISGSNAVAWWYDPLTGTASQIGTFPTTGTQNFTSPSSQEWVLVVDDEAKNFVPPGQVEVGMAVRNADWGEVKERFRQ